MYHNPLGSLSIKNMYHILASTYCFGSYIDHCFWILPTSYQCTFVVALSMRLLGIACQCLSELVVLTYPHSYYI